jgi:ketosteroid isomerase-like protein
VTVTRITPFVAVMVLLGGCVTSPPDTSGADALRDRDLAWAAVAAEGRNIDAIVSFWSDDAIVIPPGSPEFRGRAAIREYVKKSLAIPGFRIRWSPSRVVVSSDGELGYTTGENAVTFSGPDGKSTTINGRYMTVWRRERGGEWKCVVDIWNTP